MYSTLTRNRRHNSHEIDNFFKEIERQFIPLRSRAAGHPVQKADEDHATITLPLPGVDPEHIEVQVNENIVTITAEARPAKADGKVLLDEFKHTRTHRSYRLAFRPDPKKVKATSKHGVLSVELERAASDKPKKIKVLAR